MLLASAIWQTFGVSCRLVFAALIAFGLGLGCGGNPIGSKIPRADPKKMAIGAAVAASALTLANPASAGKRPERPGDRPHPKSKASTESVPGAVLDRLDDVEDSEPDPGEDRCTEKEKKRTTSRDAKPGETEESVEQKLELIPTVKNELRDECDDKPADEPAASESRPSEPRPPPPTQK